MKSVSRVVYGHDVSAELYLTIILVFILKPGLLAFTPVLMSLGRQSEDETKHLMPIRLPFSANGSIRK